MLPRHPARHEREQCGQNSEAGAHATVFTPTAYSSEARVSAWPGVDRWLGTDHEGELLGMGWPDLARLRDAGWEVGSHSVTHAALTDLDDPALQAELRDSKLAIERQLGACRSVAYPYGAVDDRVASAAKAIGYKAGAAVLPLRHGGDRMRVPRVPVLGGESELVRRLHLTRGMRRLQATRPWPAVQRAARAVRRSG